MPPPFLAHFRPFSKQFFFDPVSPHYGSNFVRISRKSAEAPKNGQNGGKSPLVCTTLYLLCQTLYLSPYIILFVMLFFFFIRYALWLHVRRCRRVLCFQQTTVVYATACYNQDIIRPQYPPFAVLKRSQDLATSISAIFLSFALFSDFHPILIQNQCGDVMIRILEFETKRWKFFDEI